MCGYRSTFSVSRVLRLKSTFIWLILLAFCSVFFQRDCVAESSDDQLKSTLIRARHFFQAGNHESAKPLFLAVLKAIDEDNFNASELGRCLDPLVEISRNAGDLQQSIEYARRYHEFVLSLPESVPKVVAEAVSRSALRLADLHKATGQSGQALEHLEESVRWFKGRNGIDRIWLAQVLVAKAELLENTAHEAEATKAWQQAQEILKGLVNQAGGPPSVRETTLSHLLVKCHLNLGEQQAAIDALKQLAARQRRARQHEELLKTLAMLTEILEKTGNTKELIQVLKLAIVSQKTVAHETTQELLFFDKLAAAEQKAGNTDAARQRYRVIVKLSSKILRKGNRATKSEESMVALRQLLTAYRRLGDFERASVVGQKLLQELRGQKVDPETVVIIQSELGAIQGRLGEYESARPLLTESLMYWRNKQPVDAMQLSRSLNNLAAIEQAIGSRQRAESLFREALQLRLQDLPDNSLLLAESHNNLGAALSAGGKYAEAIQQYLLALKVCRAASEDLVHMEMTSLLNVATAYKSQGQLDRAVRHCQEAVELAENHRIEQPGTIISLYSALASLAILQGEWDTAEHHAEEGLRSAESLRKLNSSSIDKLLHQLALIAYHRGDLSKAESYWRECLTVQQQTARHVEAAKSWAFLGHVAKLQSDYEAAEEAFEKASNILSEDPRLPTVRYVALSEWAGLLLARGEQEHAEELLNEAVEAIEAPRAELFGGESQRASYFAQFANAFDLLVEMSIEEKDLRSAIQYADQFRNRTFLDQLHLAGLDLRDTVSGEGGSQLLQRESRLKSQISSLQARLQRRMGIHSQESVEVESERLKQLRMEYREVWNDIRGSSSLYRESLRGSAIAGNHANEFWSTLDRNSAYLIYYLGSSRSHLFLIHPDQQSVSHVELVLSEEQASVLQAPVGALSRDKIAHFVRVLLSGLSSGKNTRGLGTTVTSSKGVLHGSVLTEALLPDSVINEIVEHGYENVVIVPDGALHQVPFEALQVDDGQKQNYLLDVLPPVSYAPSLTILKTLSERPTIASYAEPEVLVVGNPIYDQASESKTSLAAVTREVFSDVSHELHPLPFTEEESVRVSSTFKKQDVQLLLAEGATEEAARRHIKGKRVLHFATHGLVDQTHDNLFGAIAFTVPEESDPVSYNDGFLSLHEIHALNLRGTELAVLSACQTNVGPDQPLEAGSTMARAFLASGVRRVVCSHWSVNDQSTAELMTQFFEEIEKEPDLQCVNYAAALKKAKVALRKQSQWSGARHWAPFVLIGPAKR